jgi:hypothetical protein
MTAPDDTARCRSGCAAPWWRSTPARHPGTIVIDTGKPALYYVLGQGRAIRYGVGVGRDGFTWSACRPSAARPNGRTGSASEMIRRQPYLPRFVAGGPGNPLGARAMYLGSSQYRIHGTNDPTTIGKFVSSGCIRLTNEDVTDLFSRVNVGTRVVVLPKARRTAKPTERCARRVRPSTHPAVRAAGGELTSRRSIEHNRMARRVMQRWTLAAAALCLARRSPAPPKAQDSSRRCSRVRRAGTHFRLPFADGYAPPMPAGRRPRYGGGQAYCVRTCDGRYFPDQAYGQRQRARPAQVSVRPARPRCVYGSSIDNADTENGKPIPSCRTRFRYPQRDGAGCTCNGKDQSGSRFDQVETIRPCARATSWPARMACWCRPQRRQRGAELNFSPHRPIRAKIRPSRAGGGVRKLRATHAPSWPASRPDAWR